LKYLRSSLAFFPPPPCSPFPVRFSDLFSQPLSNVAQPACLAIPKYGGRPSSCRYLLPYRNRLSTFLAGMCLNFPPLRTLSLESAGSCSLLDTVKSKFPGYASSLHIFFLAGIVLSGSGSPKFELRAPLALLEPCHRSSPRISPLRSFHFRRLPPPFFQYVLHLTPLRHQASLFSPCATNGTSPLTFHRNTKSLLFPPFPVPSSEFACL